MSLSDSMQVTELYDKQSSKQSQQLLIQEKGFDYKELPGNKISIVFRVVILLLKKFVKKVKISSNEV